MHKQLNLVIFLLAFLVACFLHYFLFEVRYVYYNQPDDYRFLRQGHAIFLVAISLVVSIFPSKVIVALIVPFSLLFPPLLRSPAFARLDSAILIATAVITILFLLLITWRKKLGGPKFLR